MYGCETWFSQNRVRVFENRVLRGILEPKREEGEARADCIMKNFVTSVLHQILFS